MRKRLLCALLLMLLLSGCTKAPPPYAPPPSPYTPADFREEGDFLTCTAGSSLPGIDVSSHQGEIDWPAVAQSGVAFVMVRLGYRGYESGELHTDPCAVQNLAGARAAGLQVGAYFFSQALNEGEAQEELALALEVLDGFQLDLPLAYDWEFVSASARTGSMDADTLTSCTLAFCRGAEQAGLEAMIYFNSHQATELLHLQKLEDFPWWLAKYDPAMDFPCRADLWQYSYEGQLPGIAGNVDLNLIFTDYGLGKQLFAETE